MIRLALTLLLCSNVASAADATHVVPAIDPDAAPTVQLFGADDVELTPRESRAVGIARTFIEHSDDLATQGDGGAVVFRFGASIPTLVCAPLMVCDIALQPGEVVNGADAGDKVRWSITPSVSGRGDLARTHVVVKPLDVGLSTNLLITTDRRTYRIKLVSRRDDYMPAVSFVYEDDESEAWNTYRAATAARRVESATGANRGQESAPPTAMALDFAYRLSGDAPRWRPVRVYNDGVKSYVEFPADVGSGELPALVVLSQRGEHRVVNYRFLHNRFVIDGVIERAMLVSGTGRKQTTITIDHQRGGA